ncbi:hypothetical protein BRADI_2g20066v3, partial [Brachypodium distachyon]
NNLAKRRHVDDPTCVFCGEQESISHLFFDCVVSKLTWNLISDILGITIGSDFESVGRWWISTNRHAAHDIVSTAILWTIWPYRNAICFQGKQWRNAQELWNGAIAPCRKWKILCREKCSLELEQFIRAMERRQSELLRIAWR